jgi:hypothetical protein
VTTVLVEAGLLAGPRTGDLLARHRIESPALGAAAFVAVLLAFLLG